MKRLLKPSLWIGTLLCCLSITAMAASDPVAMLQQTSNQMITALQQNKATIKTNPRLVEGLARKIILPQVDTSAMSQLALGRAAWQQASASQRQAFESQFTTMMIRTYSSALAAYSNQSVTFLPVRGGTDNLTRVQVNSQIIQPGGPSIPVSYRLLSRGNGWKIYDMSVDGISLVQSFRTQFANQLNQSGMNGLLASMAQHNNQPLNS